jgi:hypothetical protein
MTLLAEIKFRLWKGVALLVLRWVASHLYTKPKQGLSSNLRNEAILGVVGTATSDLFEHDMPLDNYFYFIFSLVCLVILSVWVNHNA